MTPPLTKLDTAWLHLDEPTNRMVINGFFRFAAPLDDDRLNAALTAGFAPFERFRQRVEDRRSVLGRPRPPALALTLRRRQTNNPA